MSKERTRREGPGAAIATKEVPLSTMDGEAGHAVEPEWKRLPIGPDHILYPVVGVGLALFTFLLGDPGHHLADDMPEEDTHPFFPDHFWPYPVIAVVMLVTVGLMAAFVQQNVQLEPPADPRAVTIPRPDWYFLFLFQLLKLGNEFVMSVVVVTIVVLILLAWPFIDTLGGSRMAKRMGWKTWPVPGRNAITGTLWILGLGVVAILTLWALAGPNFCVPWPVNSPVCGA